MPTISVKRNIIANYLGSGWSSLMGLVFIPFYIHYLGIEAYALIGVFAMLQAWLFLLDMGLTPTLSREMARFLGGLHTPQSIRDLVRSVEFIFVLIAAVIAFVVMLAAPWLAANWLRVENLSTATVVSALTIIGGAIAIRWMAGLYRSAISGLQHQVWLNACTASFSTLRNLGVIPILAWVSPTVQAFFVYQGTLFALEAAVLAIKIRRLLPAPPEPARFRWRSLRQVWRFAAGMNVTMLQTILLTQVDKLLLSTLLPLTEFGYYVLASVLAGALYMVIGPVTGAAFPRFSELVARGDTVALAQTYHKIAQLLSVMAIPPALVLALFSEHFVLLWTGDAATTAAVGFLVSLLVIGNMLNGLTHPASFLQLAHGWMRLSLMANSVFILILVPAVYVFVPAYGAIAAPLIWITLNVGYVVLLVPLMHRRLLPAEMWRWYRQDVLAPALAALAAAGSIRLLAPDAALEKPFASAAILAAAAFTTLLATTLATPLGRSQLRHYFRHLIASN